jgi:peptidoglycan hydrolase-like protein with peptidoglycan-binding domain
MPIRLLAWILAGFLAGWALMNGAPVPQKKAPAKATSSAAAKKKAVTKASRSYSRSRATYSRGRKAPTPAPRRYYGQQVPAADRYKEIQQALISRGYLTTPANGVWDAASMDAMKRFQQDQNLTPTGKISSLSLIALGLGPQREQAAAIAAPPAAPPAQQ